jgi:hypothetical protein
MKKLYDLAVKTGSYEKNGETKNKYENIGAIMEGENGKFIFIKRTFNPAGVEVQPGRSDIIVSMFAPKSDAAPEPAAPHPAVSEGEIPF